MLQLENQLFAIEKSGRAQVAVLILRSTNPMSIDEFGLQLGKTWRLGSKELNNGLIVIVATEDGRIRIEVGTGLEQAISVSVAGEIISEKFVPKLRENGLFGGLSAAIAGLDQAIPAEIAKRAGNVKSVNREAVQPSNASTAVTQGAIASEKKPAIPTAKDANVANENTLGRIRRAKISLERGAERCGTQRTQATKSYLESAISEYSKGVEYERLLTTAAKVNEGSRYSLAIMHFRVANTYLQSFEHWLPTLCPQ
jgi:hypothetical protein